MQIKKLNYKDYKSIKTLIKKNNSNVITLKSFKILNNFLKKNSTIILDGLYDNKELVGFHVTIKKIIIYQKQLFNVLVSSNWNVLKKYRNYSFVLINKYLSLKSDLYLTTTANNKVSDMWKLFGAHEINNETCKFTLFKIVNYVDLIDFFLKKKIKYSINFISSFIGIFLNLIFSYKNLFLKNKNQLILKPIKKKCLELEFFNKKFEKKSKFPIEVRSGGLLFKYLDILELNQKKTYIYKIIKKKNMIGYVVLVGEKYDGYTRMFLAEIRINDEFNYFINEIFTHICKIAKEKKYSIIYFKHLQPRFFKFININFFSITKHNFNSYLIKLGSKKSKKLKAFFKNSWSSSYLDGDSLL